jgi:hypothetical protein
VFAFACPRIPKLQIDQKECGDTLRVTPAPVPVNGRQLVNRAML